MASTIMREFFLIAASLCLQSQYSNAFLPATTFHGSSAVSVPLFGATELPDSLEDAATRAAESTTAFASAGQNRCRVDFDTSIGDETFTLLKQSTEFAQNYVTAMSYSMIPGLQQQRQNEMMAVAKAKAELSALQNDGTDNTEEAEALLKIINSNGRDNSQEWEGPLVRVYFPDEGSAALARRDWEVPVACRFSSCGGVQQHSIEKDALVIFFCPKASESESVEEILQRHELSTSESDTHKLTVFINPILVDMGVTGFGMAGRMLRERLIDPLVGTYYLRTLPWGALTRQWPNQYTVWQEDTEESTGYRLIKCLDYLPSNPDVEDIYDIENGNMSEKQSGGFLDQFGDFVNGMMSL